MTSIDLPRTIFFDAVGTLIYPEPSAPAVYAAVGQRFGSRYDEAVIAIRFRTAFHHQEEMDHANGLRTSEEREVARWRAIVREVLDDVTDAEACFQELFAHFAQPDAWRCTLGTSEVLGTLASRGHVLGLASNFDRRLRGIVEGLPALRQVPYLVISSAIGWRKPAGAFFAEMARQAGLAPGNLLYVGDSYVDDYEGAQAAGLRSVLLDPHHRGAGVDCIKCLEDLVWRSLAEERP